MSVPNLLSELLDDMSSGAILKRCSDGRLAVMVDFDGEMQVVVAMVKDGAVKRVRDAKGEGDVSFFAKDVEVKTIKPNERSQWIVLVLGNDISIMDFE